VFRHDQARRLMKKKYYDLNPEWSVEFSMDFYGLELFGERVFRLVYPMLGIDQNFRIESLVDEGLLSQFRVKAVSINPKASEWNATLEEGTAPAIPPSTSEDASPQTPTGLSVVVGNPGTPRAMLSWSAPPTGKSSEAQYKLSAASDWTTITLPSPTDNTTTLTPLTPASNYDFRVRFSDPTIGVSSWATVSFAANAIVGTTTAMTSLTTLGGVMSLTATAVQSAAAAAAYVEFVALPTGASLVWTGSQTAAVPSGGSSVKVISVTNPGVYDVYARSIGINGDTGAVLGPITATVVQVVSTSGASGSSSGSGSGNNSGGSDLGSSGYSPPSNGYNPLYDGGSRSNSGSSGSSSNNNSGGGGLY
jgi:Fibronectin type III domain